jgi:flavin reductase (DIM6/NTAB) family NADH-FMN oxidoreductase RutF
MHTFSTQDFQSWDRFYRANFINSLSGYKPAFLVGTVNETGQPNLAIFSNIIHLGADPALIGMLNRPREAAPHTLSNIEKTGEYTLNMVSKNMVDAGHQTSAKYPADISEFDATELTPCWREGCKAPFVEESPIELHLEKVQIIPIELNGTFFIIGALKAVHLDPSIVESDGFLDLAKEDIICTQGIDGYFLPERIKRLPYAKPSIG